MNMLKGMLAVKGVRVLCVAAALLCVAAQPADAKVTNQWEGEGRYFKQVAPGKWQEFFNGAKAFDFNEVTRSADIIHLHDTSRDITVVLSKNQAKILKTGTFQFAYTGKFVYVVFAYSGGEFRVMDGGRWEEWQNGKLAFSFVETGRNASSVTLYDSSRGIRVVVTSSDFQVYSGESLLFKKKGQYVR